MKVVILDSGIGKRMKPFTDNSPKCLSPLNGTTILGNQIEIFKSYGLNDFIITTGHLEDKIKEFISSNFPDAKTKYVYNPRYATTNCIYSLYLAKDLMHDDIVWLHGDMVFRKELFGKLLNSKKPNCVLVNNGIKPPEKDFKVDINNNLVSKISVSIKGKNVFFLAPIYKISKKDFAVWMREVENMVKHGIVNVYAEEAFNSISSKIKLHPVYFKDELCMEIDNYEDLKIARKSFK